MKKTILSPLLFLVLFACVSCSHYTDHKSRTPANLSQRQYLSKLREESARYILSYEPNKFGDYDALLGNEEELYKLLGKIDLNTVPLIHSKLTGSEKGYKSIFNLSRVEQIDYARWQEMKSDVVETYSQGKYVFFKDGSFYTLSGLKLSLRDIDHRVFIQAKKYVPELNPEDLALSIFNRETFYSLGESAALVLPTGHYIMQRHFHFLMDDFEKQVGDDIQINPIDLVNYNYKAPSLDLGQYKVYRTKKYQAFLNNESVRDSKTACDTKFYFRSLSRRTEAQKFVDTLLHHKPRLMEELRLTNNEYDELMLLSLGILAVESKMGTSLKYKIKEDIKIGRVNLGQFAIKLLKRLKGRSDENSRGLTQIKDIGPLLKDSSYGYLEHSDLDDPENAALATMFVLKEKLGYLRHFADRHPNITDDNWADYLYYFYQGASSQITKGLATPPLNLRIQKILKIKEDSMIITNCD